MASNRWKVTASNSIGLAATVLLIAACSGPLTPPSVSMAPARSEASPEATSTRPATAESADTPFWQPPPLPLPSPQESAETTPSPQPPTPSPQPLTPTPQPLAPSPQPLTPTPCPTAGQITTGAYPSQITGPERAYRIYLPPCYGQDGRVYPTLYMLHGSASTDSHWDDLGLDETAETAIQTQTLPPFLIVMPNGGDAANFTSGGPFSFEEVILTDLIPFVEQSYCAWAEPAGRAIGGLSRGGYWALEIAFRHPADFGSVGGHSAALLDQFAGPDLNPQYTALSNNLGSLRIYLDIGADDWLIAPLQQLHEDMVVAEIPHTWVLNLGRHEDAYWAEHAAEYLTWYTQPWPRDRHAYPLCSSSAEFLFAPW